MPFQCDRRQSYPTSYSLGELHDRVVLESFFRGASVRSGSSSVARRLSRERSQRWRRFNGSMRRDVARGVTQARRLARQLAVPAQG